MFGYKLIVLDNGIAYGIVTVCDNNAIQYHNSYEEISGESWDSHPVNDGSSYLRDFPKQLGDHELYLTINNQHPLVIQRSYKKWQFQVWIYP